MAAVINQRPAASTSSLGPNAKPELLQKIEGQVGRIIGISLLAHDDEEGFVTINEDKTLRVILKRDTGRFWPSVVQNLPSVPSKLFCNEKTNAVLVGYVNGLVQEFALGEDKNVLTYARQWSAHTSTVTGLVQAPLFRQMYSCGKDKTVVWHCMETAQRTGAYTITSSCTCLELDVGSRTLFLGDYAGNIHVLRLVDGSAQFVSKLCAHTGAISDLAWDTVQQLLFSSSTDSLVIMWDIGGKQGRCYELNGHEAKVSRLALASTHRRLFSADDSGHLMCWDLKANRIVAPAWRDSDKCELCNVPFFWNLKVMWDRKVVGLRRHHCRTCGLSVCANCCAHRTVFPAMGFEKPARICNTCRDKMQDYPDSFDLTPLAAANELRQGVVDMCFRESAARLVTVGYDRVIMLWDVSNML